MISTKLRNIIFAALTKDRFFSETDFAIVDSDQKEKGARLVVTYLCDPRYVFTAMVPRVKSSTDNSGSPAQHVRFNASPGDMAFEEPGEALGPAGLAIAIHDWSQRIKTEIENEPLARRVTEQAARLTEVINSVGEVADGVRFNASEVVAMRERLDKLEQQVAANLQQDITDKRELDRELKRLHEDVATLKTQVAAFAKKSMLRRFADFSMKWFEKPGNRQLAEAAVKGLLASGSDGGGPSNGSTMGDTL